VQDIELMFVDYVALHVIAMQEMKMKLLMVVMTTVIMMMIMIIIMQIILIYIKSVFRKFLENFANVKLLCCHRL
jgi:hypothetical protein